MASDYWQDKVCLITGASAGLGRALAATLAREGAALALVSRRQDPLEQAVAQFLPGGHVDVLALTGDMAWQEDVDRVRQAIADRWGRLDLLCNCVGRSARGRVLETTPEDFQQLWDANFVSAVRCTRACSKMLLASGGHVVNVGSLASRFGPPYMGAYPAAKHALAGYTQQLRMEHGPNGLHALLVCPGPIAGGNANRYADQADDLPDAAAQRGAGAKLRGLDPERLTEKILRYCERRKPELVAPAYIRSLLVVAQISPRLGDWLLRRFTPG